MTLLRPTPSRRPWLNYFPLWTLVVGGALAALVLVGLGLLFGIGGEDGDDVAAPVAAPCESQDTADSTTTPPEDWGRLNVYNSTDRRGLAADTADEFGDRGFTIGKVANDPRDAHVTASAEVRFGPRAKVQARWIAAHVPGAELAPTERKSRNVDLVLGEAFNGVAGKKAARKAFEKSAAAAC